MASHPLSDTDPIDPDAPDGLAALAGAGVAGLVLALGFVALMARVGGPAPVQASVALPAAPVAVPVAEARPAVPSLYDESGAH